MTHQKIISIHLSLGRFQDFVINILELGQRRQSSYVCVANVHMCIETYQDHSFADIVNSADIVTPDGMPLVKAMAWLFGIKQDKVSGPDLMPALLAAAETQNTKVYFFGSTDEVLAKLFQHCSERYPNLLVAGMYSPPFRKLSEAEVEQDVQRINDSGANIVFVALGCPKQERWMASMKGRINAVMVGVGGAFPMLVGVQKRAPLWMQRYALEWLFRLIQEPRRLFKRYLITNTLFVLLIFKEKLRLIGQKK